MSDWGSEVESRALRLRTRNNAGGCRLGHGLVKQASIAVLAYRVTVLAYRVTVRLLLPITTRHRKRGFLDKESIAVEKRVMTGLSKISS